MFITDYPRVGQTDYESGKPMRVKTTLAAALCVPLLTIAGAGTAFAGEVSGPPRGGVATGDWTPVARYVMHSICAFSGLNADHPGKPLPPAGFPAVQSYGMSVKAGDKATTPSPREACNGHTGWLVTGEPG